MNKAKYKQKIKDAFPGFEFTSIVETGSSVETAHIDGDFQLTFLFQEDMPNRVMYSLYLLTEPKTTSFSGLLRMEEGGSIPSEVKENFVKMLVKRPEIAFEDPSRIIRAQKGLREIFGV